MGGNETDSLLTKTRSQEQKEKTFCQEMREKRRATSTTTRITMRELSFLRFFSEPKLLSGQERDAQEE